MSGTHARYHESEALILDHDSWNYSIPKLPRSSAITSGEIHGVLPFDGHRNPSARSSVSQKVFMPYRTAANDWQPRIGIAESAAEAAVACEALMCPDLYDLAFQPLVVDYQDDDGRRRSHTFDLLITMRNGHRRLIFERNAASLRRDRTSREIRAIHQAVPRNAANDMIIVNADAYSRQRRDNLRRMHAFVFDPDPEADEAVLTAAHALRSFHLMGELFPHAGVAPQRAFAACYRLVARGMMGADLDNLLWENAHLWITK